jgi:hypothetical protein
MYNSSKPPPNSFLRGTLWFEVCHLNSSAGKTYKPAIIEIECASDGNLHANV